MQKKFGIAVVTALPTTNTPGGSSNRLKRGVFRPTANALRSRSERGGGRAPSRRRT
jgi:hypothetical protein